MNILTRHQMREDLAQLCSILVEAHPDPFWGSGGHINFYRKVDGIYSNLPEELPVDMYLALLRPLVASLRDGHTKIGTPGGLPESSSRIGVDFDILAEGLYVKRAFSAEYQSLLGYRLRAVNGVTVDRIGQCIKELMGSDNEIQVLCQVADAFHNPPIWDNLLGAANTTTMTFCLVSPNGESLSVDFPWTREPITQIFEPPTRVSLPKMESTQLGWGFIDDKSQVAVLRVGSLMRYREAGEVWQHSGFHRPLLEWYAEATGLMVAPSNRELNDFLQELPSATAVLDSCLDAMNEAGTPWLIVDVRESPGGNSVLADMLGWTLYGEVALSARDEGYQIRRYSALYQENYGEFPKQTLAPGGYDFREEEAWIKKHGGEEYGTPKNSREWMKPVPTFQEGCGRLAQPRPQVIVVTSARTYSAGFDVVLTLTGLGAIQVGVPSGQAPNCFIDILRFMLFHSQLQGVVSFKKSVALPQLGPDVRTLAPLHELTYENLRSYNFDPAAGILLALESIESRTKG